MTKNEHLLLILQCKLQLANQNTPQDQPISNIFYIAGRGGLRLYGAPWLKLRKGPFLYTVRADPGKCGSQREV